MITAKSRYLLLGAAGAGILMVVAAYRLPADDHRPAPSGRRLRVAPAAVGSASPGAQTSARTPPDRAPLRPLFNSLVQQRGIKAAPPVAPAAASVPLKPAPAPRREAAPATAPDAAAPAPPARLTLVGVMDGIGAPQAIVQDVEFGLAQTVRVGEEVFAHRVTRITAEEVTLERNGATRTLRLGGEKADGRIEELSDGLNLQLSDPRNAALASLPSNVILTLARLMPRQGTLKRVRTEVRDGQRVHEVERDIEGRDYEIHLGDNGQVIQIEQELQRTDLPPAVLAAANSAVPGYKINPGDNPKLWDRDGRRYYEVEIRQEGGEAEIDLQISPEGKIIGRG